MYIYILCNILLIIVDIYLESHLYRLIIKLTADLSQLPTTNEQILVC